MKVMQSVSSINFTRSPAASWLTSPVSRYSQADGKIGYLSETKDYTFGINWLPEDNVKFLFGFSKVKDKDFTGNKKKYNLYQVEARYFF